MSAESSYSATAAMMWSMLQWGRGFDEPREGKSQIEDAPDVRRYASMGPRFDERGKPALALLLTMAYEASMGPRFDERGKAAMAVRVLRDMLASMGPRLISRGKENPNPTPSRKTRCFNGAAGFDGAAEARVPG